LWSEGQRQETCFVVKMDVLALLDARMC
jgi:hypothetical protein